MDVEGFIARCFQEGLGDEMVGVSATSMPGTVYVRVVVRGRLEEAETIAVALMAEFAELDRTLHIAVERGGKL